MKNLIKNMYYYSYLIAKLGGIIWYYYLLLEYKIPVLVYPNIMVIILYFLVHLLQIYFCIKILKKISIY